MKISECKTLNQLIEYHKEDNEKGITFIDKHEDEMFVSYKKLYQNALTMLARLEACGIDKNKQVILQLSDEEELITVIWACVLGHVVVVPMTVADKEEEMVRLVNVFQKLESPFILTAKEVEKQVAYEYEKLNQKTCKMLKDKTINIDNVERQCKNAILYEAEEDEIAFILFTSGSTGQPKGVTISHHNMVNALREYTIAYKTNYSEAVFLNWLSVTHMMGLIITFTPLYSDDNYYVMSILLFQQKPIAWFEKVNEHRINLLSASNFSLKFLLTAYKASKKEYHWDLSCLRGIGCGSESTSRDVVESFLQEMSKYNLKRTAFCSNYGMTEACALLSSDKIDKEYKWYSLSRQHIAPGQQIVEVSPEDKDSSIFVSVGEKLDSCELRICDAKDKPVAERIVGRVEFRGEGMTPGYYKNDEANKNAHALDGWFITGDLGFLDKGQLVITGREKEMLILNGQNYYVIDIERVAMEIEEVLTAVVFEVNEEDIGREQIVLCVQSLLNGEEFERLARKLHQYVQSKTGLTLTYIIPVDKIPVGKTGKVKRITLKEHFLRNKKSFHKLEDGQEDYIAPRNKLEKEIAKVWSDILEIKNIGVRDNFYNLGGNSLHMNFIVARLRDMDLNTSIKYFTEHPTIEALAKHAIEEAKVQVEDQPVGEIVPLANRELLNVRDGCHDVNHWNIGVLFEVYPIPEKEILEEVIKHLLRYHDGLRLRYRKAGLWWEQFIGELDEQLPLTYVDLAQVADDQQIDKMEAEIDHIQNNTSLEQMPVRFALFTFGKKKAGRIYMIAHHAIVDGYSITLLQDDFTLLYKQAMAGENLKLPQKTTSLRRWSKYLEEYAQTEKVKQELDVWKTPEKGVTSIPVDYPDEINHNYFKYETVMVRSLLTKEETDVLFHKILKQDTAINDVIVTALLRGIEKWTGNREALLDYTFNGRYPLDETIDLSRTIGWIAFLAPVYFNFSEYSNINDVFHYVKTRIHSIPNGGLGYGCLRRLCKDAEIRQCMSKIPYPEVMYNYVKFDFEKNEPDNDNWGYIKRAKESAGQNEGDNITRGRLIDFVCETKNDQLTCKIQYSRNIHKQDTMEKFYEYVKEELHLLLKELIKKE